MYSTFSRTTRVSLTALMYVSVMSEGGWPSGHLSMSATPLRSMFWGRRFMAGAVPRGLPGLPVPFLSVAGTDRDLSR